MKSMDGHSRPLPDKGYGVEVGRGGRGWGPGGERKSLSWGLNFFSSFESFTVKNFVSALESKINGAK